MTLIKSANSNDFEDRFVNSGFLVSFVCVLMRFIYFGVNLKRLIIAASWLSAIACSILKHVCDCNSKMQNYFSRPSYFLIFVFLWCIAHVLHVELWDHVT